MKIPVGLKKSAAMVILRHEQRLLLLKRNKAPNAGRYVPVGGKLEPFEDPYSAARRETKEETGIELSRLHYAGVLIETSPTRYNWQCNIYLADIPDLEPPSCDEGILEWVGFDRLHHIPTPPTDWQIYQYVIRRQPFALNAIYNEKLELIRMVEEIEGVVVEGQ